MKNAILFGLYIGLLSGAWLLIMHWSGYGTFNRHTSALEYISIIIPVSGLYFGILAYRKYDMKGQLSFFQALMQCIGILIAGGLIAGFITIVYENYFSVEYDLMDLVGWLFGAIPVSLIASLAVSLILMTRSNEVD